MMSLNLKLQSSAAKNQARNIDLELRKIEAREAKELLSIIQVRRVCMIPRKEFVNFLHSLIYLKFTLSPIPMLHIVIYSSRDSPQR